MGDLDRSQIRSAATASVPQSFHVVGNASETVSKRADNMYV